MMPVVVVAHFEIDDQAQPAGCRLGWHVHAEPLLSLVLSGTYEEGFAGRTAVCRRLDVVVKPAGERHFDRVGRAGARSLLVSVVPGTDGRLRELVDRLTVPRVIRTASVHALVGRAWAEWSRPDEFSSAALEALLLDAIVEAGRASHSEMARDSGPAWLARAEEVLRDRSPSVPGLSDVARECGVSPATLARAFRRAYGCSIGEFARRLRLDVAMRLVVRSDLPLAEVAARSGFFDQSHMGRAFRRARRPAPSALRAGHRQP